MRAHSRKRPALAATTFINSRGGRLQELRLLSVEKVARLFGPITKHCKRLYEGIANEITFGTLIINCPVAQVKTFLIVLLVATDSIGTRSFLVKTILRSCNTLPSISSFAGGKSLFFFLFCFVFFFGVNGWYFGGFLLVSDLTSSQTINPSLEILQILTRKVAKQMAVFL